MVPIDQPKNSTQHMSASKIFLSCAEARLKKNTNLVFFAICLGVHLTKLKLKISVQ